ncbi:hypothetical protein CN165_30935 [Sinorhizobium medicae]|uniref:hypothetical protein n=1 Tax=Sinorhizobium medicae TaxID=110321 RepID=UPI000FD93A56|nr:hypothetical protein [Sinorhizobium medicae]RVK09162.1 hypothetical protein CN165_30935 [Sinorhizobium medicae]
MFGQSLGIHPDEINGIAPRPQGFGHIVLNRRFLGTNRGEPNKVDGEGHLVIEALLNGRGNVLE